MFFLQSNQSPVIIRIDGTEYPIPRFTIDDFVVWGSEIRDKRFTHITEGMTEYQVKQFKAAYPSTMYPPDIEELKRLVFTADGAKRVLKQCLTNGGVADPIIESVLKRTGSLMALAELLADMRDESTVDPNPPPPPTPTEPPADPLKSSGKDGSSTFPAIG